MGFSAFEKNKIAELEMNPWITEIHTKAFAHNFIRKLTIPSEVTWISDKAFAENLLKSLTFLPGKTLLIGRGAFKTNYLSELKLHNRVRGISEEAFADNQLESLVVPYQVTHIKKDAFRKNLLTTIRVKGPTELDDGAFFENPSLKTVKLHTLMGYSAFDKYRVIWEITFSFSYIRVYGKCDRIRDLGPRDRFECKNYVDLEWNKFR